MSTSYNLTDLVVEEVDTAVLVAEEVGIAGLLGVVGKRLPVVVGMEVEHPLL